jgi:transcriptional regulator with XRE-family HTH domain
MTSDVRFGKFLRLNTKKATGSPMSIDAPDSAPTSAFGQLLKFWRGVRGVSQEELALRIDSAARHLSRLEKGGAHPSREMVKKIADALSLGKRDTNHLLMFAGYAVDSQAVDLSAPDHAVLRTKIIRNLMALDPLPTLVTTVFGDLLMVNRAWAGLQQALLPHKKAGDRLNFYELALDFMEQGAVPQEWRPTLSVILLSLEQQVLLSGDPELEDMFSRLVDSPEVPDDWAQKAADTGPGGYFGVTVPVAGEAQPFFIHSHHLNLLGPLGFSSRPDMIVMTFYPVNENLDCTPLASSTAQHPLLFY